MATDSWHLRSRSHECAATGHRFEEDEPFYTAIFPDPESSGYLRRDFTLAAWDARGEGDETPFSFWRTVYKAPPVEHKPEMVEKESAEDLLKRLVDEDEEHTENVRYILAVMLERKKLLVETDSQQTNNGLLRIYEHRKTGDIFIVKDPQIPLSEIEPLQQEVQALLEPKEEEPEELAEAAAGEESPEN
jgi:hypothetical protein